MDTTASTDAAQDRGGQSRLESIYETGADVVTGYLFSLLIWYSVIASGQFDINTSHAENFSIQAIFVVASFLRRYATRRWFNNRVNR